MKVAVVLRLPTEKSGRVLEPTVVTDCGEIVPGVNAPGTIIPNLRDYGKMRPTARRSKY
jgi:hypothetical protein